MTPTDLRRIGEALYGERFQAPLARELGMSDRHMRRLLAGHAPITAGIEADVWRVVRSRIQTLRGLLRAA